MKKTLIYTTCDFSPNSYQCTELLYRSLTVYNSENDFDFCVISDKNPSECMFPIILIESGPSNNLSTWKYTNKLPKGYERYFYLDSDILCFGKIDDMFDDSDLSLITEIHPKPYPMSDSEYFCYKYATPEEKIEMKKYNGFVAGSFGFKKMEFISGILDMMKPKLSNIIIPVDIPRAQMHDMILPDALLDETSFNYWIFKRLPGLKYCDLSDKTIIRPDGMLVTDDKIIYHFCGFRMEMGSKYQRMLNFCSINCIQL